MRLLPLLVALALLAAAPARAGLSLAGPTGLVVMPTALTLHQWEGDFAVDNWGLKTPTQNDGDFTVVRAAVGVQDGPPDSGVEIGITNAEADDIGLTDPYLFGKYRIPGILPGGALAVGGLFSTEGRNYSSIFLVGSSAIAPRFALHYGGGINVYGDPNGYAWFGGRRSNGRANGGFALFGAEFDWRRFKLNLDYNGSFMSAGINYFPDSVFSLSLFKLGRGDYERALGLKHRIGVGANLRF
jgi:hypothetical protein